MIEARAARSPRATGAFRAWRTDFVQRDSAIAVFVELFQRGRGDLDFLFVNHAIVIHVERGPERA
jgi:hypothetical protein